MISAVAVGALAALSLAVAGAPYARAAGPNDPFSCATANPVAQASTIAYGSGSGAQSQVLGRTPSSCVLNGLSYNAADGYLYAFENKEVVTNPCAVTYAMVKIGRDSSGAMAIDAIGHATSATAAAPADNCLVAAAADADPGSDTVLLPGSYLNVSATALADLDNFKPYIASVSAASGAVTNVAETFDASCVPYLQNFIAQNRAYFYRLGYLAARPGSNDGQVGPEGTFQDWSFNPADGRLYAYVSVDLRQSSYPTQVPADPTGTLGAPADNTQTYLGSKVAIPTYSWAPAGVASASYTITTQSDWILKIDPTSGATTCAAAGSAASSGAINLPGAVFANSSAANPIYAPSTTTLIAGGGVEIAGSAFSGPDTMELFDSEQARHFTINPSSCTFGSIVPSCMPTLQPDALPDGRSRGDAAAFAGREISVRKTATGAGSTSFTFTVRTGAAPEVALAVTNGATKTATVDAFATSIDIDENATAGWTLKGATCDYGVVAKTSTGITVDVSSLALTVVPVCTFVNTATGVATSGTGALANTGPTESRNLTWLGFGSLLAGFGLLLMARRNHLPGWARRVTPFS
jgi:LPXTG-motif cell wall-anchored protein